MIQWFIYKPLLAKHLLIFTQYTKLWQMVLQCYFIWPLLVSLCRCWRLELVATKAELSWFISFSSFKITKFKFNSNLVLFKIAKIYKRFGLEIWKSLALTSRNWKKDWLSVLASPFVFLKRLPLFCPVMCSISWQPSLFIYMLIRTH